MLNDADETISTLAPRLAACSLSATTLLDACLARIAAHDPTLHAILALAPGALDEARDCDAERAAGRLRGPLHGVPMVVKDNIDVAGLPTTSGCRALAHAMPRGDAAQVARLRAAGAVIVGKANLSEFSFEIRSRSSLGGDTRNPFLPHVTSGGSSGGTAVAVAAGFAIAGLGTDTGGSIRVPAAFNGLVGLRPTYGLLDLAGVAPLAPSTDTIGPLARSVADAALLFDVMGGAAGDIGQSVVGVRVGVLRQAFGHVPAIAAAAEAACAALKQAGAQVADPAMLPEAALTFGGVHIVDAEFAGAFNAYLATNFVDCTAPGTLAEILASGDYLPDHRAALEKRVTAPNVAARHVILARHRQQRAALDGLMIRAGLDVLLHPTAMVMPSSLDNPKGGWAPELAARSGWPALALPGGRCADGVPIGVELLARPGAESLLFRCGQAIERALGPRPLPPL